ncbi:alpha/beta fold hydrolase [Methylocystis iwaonis]|uniref:alpha/beta fold hydrolase n=1 Tax=Methylocystis iwaonis TaxID=2885079 RepID=UPI002E7B8B70|nr:alpha/beta fold hydrolase [Methylocystis iwaonis]
MTATIPTAFSAAAEGGIPVTFSGCAGFYHPGGGDVAVLMCSAWGYEELCVRASWRQMADELTAAGFPTLRFDYPGVCDSLGASAEPWRLDDWIDAAKAAAALLLDVSQARRIIVLGQGLGAGVAILVSQQLSRVEGLVLLASFSKGRAYVRELSVSATMLADAAGVSIAARRDGSLTMLGFELPASFVGDLKKLNFLELESLPAPRVLLVDRVQSHQELANHFNFLGAAVEQVPYTGYEELVSNPTITEHPRDVFSGIVGHMVAWSGDRKRPYNSTPRAPQPAKPLAGPLWRETPLHLANGHVFGVFCEPLAPRVESVALFLNCGANPHTGWRRMTVDHARVLAAHGIASLRIDTTGIGDCPAPIDFGERIYTQAQTADVLAAVDWLAGQGRGKVSVIGVCSGAYQAFHAAIRDPRIEQAIIINLVVFARDPARSVSELIKYHSRSNMEYFSRVLDRDGLIKLLKGQAPIRKLLSVVLGRIADSAKHKLMWLIHSLVGKKLLNEPQKRLAELAARGTRISFVTSAGDLAEDELTKYFGKNCVGLGAYDNVTWSRIQNADHNLTTQESVDWLRDHLLARLDDPIKSSFRQAS